MGTVEASLRRFGIKITFPAVSPYESVPAARVRPLPPGAKHRLMVMAPLERQPRVFHLAHVWLADRDEAHEVVPSSGPRMA